MKTALAQVSTLNAPFEADVADYAAGQCPAIELWLTKLEKYLENHSLPQVQSLLEEHGVQTPVASFQGGLLTSQAERRVEHWDHFARRLDLCRQLGVEVLVIAGDVTGPLTQQDLERATMSLRQAAEQAAARRVLLALEFQSSAVFANNLQTAIAWLQQVGHPSLGLCLDTFHYATGPSKPEDLADLTGENLFHVQLSDLSGKPRELAADADRILPGDGDLVLQPIIDRLRKIDYQRYVSVELMNPSIWQVPPLSFGEIGITALRKVLGIASMGDPG